MSEHNAPSAPTNGITVASLVLGIVSIVFCFAGIGVVAGIIGLVLGISANKEAPSGMATAGLVLSVIGVVLGGIFTLSCLACRAACISFPWHTWGRFW